MPIPDSVILAALDKIGPYPGKVAKAVGMSYDTLYHRIMRHPELKEIWDMARVERVDLAEGIVDKSLKAGDLKTAMFVLRTLGRDRGYVTGSEITGQNGDPVRIAIGPDLTNLTEEQYHDILARLAEAAKAILG